MNIKFLFENKAIKLSSIELRSILRYIKAAFNGSEKGIRYFMDEIVMVYSDEEGRRKKTYLLPPSESGESQTNDDLDFVTKQWASWARTKLS